MSPKADPEVLEKILQSALWTVMASSRELDTSHNASQGSTYRRGARDPLVGLRTLDLRYDASSVGPWVHIPYQAPPMSLHRRMYLVVNS
jgi:hypothetical protein